MTSGRRSVPAGSSAHSQRLLASTLPGGADVVPGPAVRVAELASERRWTEASELLVDAVVPRRGMPARARPLIVWPVLAADVLVRPPPRTRCTCVVTVLAERTRHDFRGRLHEIIAPTLGSPAREEVLLHEALDSARRRGAANPPALTLCGTPGMGHPARGHAVRSDVLAFLGCDVPGIGGGMLRTARCSGREGS